MRRIALVLVSTPLLFAGCFADQGASDGSGDGNGSGNSDGTGSDGDGNGDNDGSGSGDGNSDSGNSDATGSDDSGDTDDSGDSGGEGEDPKFDTLGVPDAPACSGGGGGDPEFSYIWIANSQQNTISKIDTQTMVEEGRYLTRPDGTGNPSRTSVSLSGNVAVANRTGGVTKVHVLSDACAESNGMPGIQTATDANFLPWGTEECHAWHTPMNYSSQRPVAWAQGTFNSKIRGSEDEQVWTAGTNGSTIDVVLLNGDDGSIDQQVNLGNDVSAGYFGIYGGAVDGDGNFWGSQLGTGKLVKVEREDMSYQVWPMATSGYGMTVDHEGYVWTCSSSVGKFDPETETWQTAQVGGSGGCMGDGEDTLWVSANTSGLVGVDMETLQVKDTVNVNNTYIHGTSVDFYGYVWAVSYNTPFAYRVDPDSLQFDTFTGLTGPYTYSDMTGFALSAAGVPSG